MKIELSIKDDKELRDTIRDMIKGQVASLARKEVVDAFRKAAEKKAHLQIDDLVANVERVFRQEARQMINEALTSDGTWCATIDFVRETVKAEINERLKKLTV